MHLFHLLLALGAHGKTNVLTSQLDAKSSLHLTKNLLVGGGSAGLVVVNNLGLLVDLDGKLLLGETLVGSALGDGLSNRGLNLGRGNDIVGSIDLGQTLAVSAILGVGGGVLLVDRENVTSSHGSVDLGLRLGDSGSRSSAADSGTAANNSFRFPIVRHCDGVCMCS